MLLMIVGRLWLYLFMLCINLWLVFQLSRTPLNDVQQVVVTIVIVIPIRLLATCILRRAYKAKKYPLVKATLLEIIFGAAIVAVDIYLISITPSSESEVMARKFFISFVIGMGVEIVILLFVYSCCDRMCPCLSCLMDDGEESKVTSHSCTTTSARRNESTLECIVKNGYAAMSSYTCLSCNILCMFVLFLFLRTM